MDDELFSMLLFFLFYMVAPVVGIIVLVVVLSKGKKKSSPGAPQQEKDAVSAKAPEPVPCAFRSIRSPLSEPPPAPAF